MDRRSKEKRALLEHALSEGVAMIHLDARRPGVQVPPRFRKDFHLRLNLSFRFAPLDLAMNDWGVRETLSFSGSQHPVAVPWGAIFAITGNRSADQAWMFPVDMPGELLEMAAEHFELSVDEVRELAIDPLELAGRAAPRKAGFEPRVVDGGRPPPKRRAEGAGDGERRRHLRVVK